MKGKRGGVGYVLCIDDDNSDCFGCVVKKKGAFFYAMIYHGPSQRASC